jgi:SanA protein
MKRALAIAAGFVVTVLGVCNLVVWLGGRSPVTTDTSNVPHAQAALVLGAQVMPNGAPSSMLSDRIDAAYELYRAGKVDKLLLSGDHSRADDDEVGTMRDLLLRDGIPARDLFEDHAGFDTWDSAQRARRVFDVRSAVVVTQGFHMARALYLARAAGLKASGLDADLRGYGAQGTKSDVREVLARVKAVGSALLKQRVLLGPPVPITGDGRTSWGPPAPPGTPPSGAPSG